PRGKSSCTNRRRGATRTGSRTNSCKFTARLRVGVPCVGSCPAEHRRDRTSTARPRTPRVTPVSSAFRFVLQARERLYKSGILSTLQLSRQVISVGNLTLGGTGKTPLVIALAEGLQSRGFRPVVLSRGYGRLSRGVLVVGLKNSNWGQWGDEPLLI